MSNPTEHERAPLFRIAAADNGFVIERPAHHLTVLVVDDQASVRAKLASQLDAMGHRVLEAGDADWALELFGRHHPDLVLLDVTMPGKDGYWLAARIRELETNRWTPVIFLSGRDSDEDLQKGIESGGDDYLTKPVSPVVLAAKLRAMLRLQGMQLRLADVSAELRSVNARLEYLSEHDELTGLINRRGLDRLLHDEIRAAARDEAPLTLLLCDIDYFKAYNDAHGHLEGDRCLKGVSALLKEACHRPRDRATRYGGEEFALILPNTPKSGAMTFSRALQRMLRHLAWPHPTSPLGGSITISGGITTCLPDEHTTVESMLARADEALYTAKGRGRDRYFSFEMGLDEPAVSTPVSRDEHVRASR